MKRLRGPIDVQLELTESCNFRCRHCYNYWRYGEENRKQELDETQVIEVINTLNDHGVSVITLTGGEPLLRPDILFAALKAAKKFGMEVGLNTNATLVTPTIAEGLVHYGLDHVLCSVLGKEETHNLITGSKDGFKRTVRGVGTLAEAGLTTVFISSAEVLSRSAQSVESTDSAGYGGGGCQCVSCRSCDNSCNK